ncbi:nucleolin [Drechslerella dactyloides]|uniref:Multiple RNA-binding domain-containing protein 1 n=1 Tax=Drechslerella dactyloides TaxID=74499 RepID=A0AAD6J551_DREDA|nr:nucleolin [Drechslerella dactyloides]
MFQALKTLPKPRRQVASPWAAIRLREALGNLRESPGKCPRCTPGHIRRAPGASHGNTGGNAAKTTTSFTAFCRKIFCILHHPHTKYHGREPKDTASTMAEEASSKAAGTKPLPPKSSRIFIKNLPPTNFNDAALRAHFAKLSGTSITDCRYFHDRRIAFIGYKTPEQAEAAVKHFDRSYIKTSKLTVEIAKSARDDNLSRPWSANAPASSAYAKKHNLPDASPTKTKSLKRKRDEVEPKKAEDGKAVDPNDPKYLEYMQLMKSRSNTKIWENELTVASEEQTQVVQPPEDESEDEYEEVSKINAEKKKWKKDKGTESSHQSAPEEPDPPEPATEQADPEVLPDVTSPVQTGLSDADWLKSVTSKKLETEDKTAGDKGSTHKDRSSEEEWGGIDEDERMEDAPSPEEAVSEEPPPKSEADIAVDKIAETGRLFIRNLTYSVTESELEELFSQFGDLDEVHLPIDQKTHNPKGFAYIQYSSPPSAITAFQTLDQSIFQGRNLHVLPAEAKRESQLDDYALSKLPLKKQREILKKRNAAKSDFEWNSLYMNINTVMASMADRLGVSKAELLDPTSTDAAVKQAHAETRVIQDTKSYFEQHGVNLASFAKKKRGDKVVLIKNFAYGTSAEELRALCNEFGETKRVLMPPAGTIAIVEFLDDPSGRAAFARLYGRKFKESILKVEKAPEDIFTAPIEPAKKPAAPTAPTGNLAKPSVKDLISTSAADDDFVPGETSSLFVKNLSFNTTSEKLKDLFAPMEGFLAARVKTKPDPKNPGKTLSMGYGFVEFRTKTFADAASAAANGHFLDGHKLEIRGSHRGEDAAAERKKADARKNAAGTKIIIKNLAFEVSEKQIRNLFGQYGKLRSVRLPKKFNRTSRGFGFAQFVSTREAENAMEALRHTHLHGRPLVLEWARGDAQDAEEEIQRLQKKVGKQVDSVMFAKLSGAAGRKKFDIEETAAGRAAGANGDDDWDE